MRLSYLFVVVCVFTFSIQVFSQPLPIAWQKSYGGSNEDYATSIISVEGGYVVVGTSYSADGDITGPVNGSGDLWITKISADGTLLWDKNFGSAGLEVAQSIQQTADSGFIICGWTSSYDVPHYHGSNDGWIVKLDKFGHMVWNKAYGGSGSDLLFSISKTNDGGYIAVGGAISPEIPGYHTGIGGDFWVVKIDDTGAIEWEHCFGGSAGETANSVIQASDNNFVITGYTGSEDGDVTGHHGAMYIADIWTIKLNSSGGLIWQRCHGGTALEEGRSILETMNGNYIIAGSAGSSNGDVSVFHGGDTTYGDAWVVMLDDTGALVWEKTYGGSRNDGAVCIIPTTDSSFVFAGWTHSSDGDVSGKHDSTDFWVVKIDDTGMIEWQKCLGGSKQDKASSICKKNAGEYAICGSSYSFDGDVTINKGLGDTWVVKLGNDPVAIRPVEENPTFCVYPNPTEGKFQISGSGFAEEGLHLSISDIYGRTCYVNNSVSSSNYGTIAEIDLTAMPAGLYIISLYSLSYYYVSSVIKE